MDIARETQMARLIELRRPHAVAGAGDPALGRAVGETWILFAALPGHHMGRERRALARQECGTSRLRLEALLDGGADFARGGVDEVVAEADGRVLREDHAALDVERFARAQLRGEASDVLGGRPAVGQGEPLADGCGGVGDAVEVIGDGEMPEAVALPRLHDAAVCLDRRAHLSSVAISEGIRYRRDAVS